MKDYIVQPKLPAYCIKEFLGSINSIKIDQIVAEGNLEALINFTFLKKKFVVYWDFDLWIFSPDSGDDAIEFAHLIECIEAQNNNKLNNFIIILKRKLLFL